MAKEAVNDQVTEENNEAAGLAKEYFEDKGEKSRQNRVNGGNDVVISLTNKNDVKFTKDFGKHFKKGDTLEGISDAAFEIYNKKGVIEKLN